LAFLGGVLLVHQLPGLPSWWWAGLLLPLAWLAWRQPHWLAAVFFVAGVLWMSWCAGLILDERLPSELEGKTLAVEGRIADIPQAAAYGQRFRFDVDRAWLKDRVVSIPRRILLTSSERNLRFRVGERWRMHVRLKRPHGFQNPGGFDYEAYLFRQRIRAKGYVRSQPLPRLLESESIRFAVGRVRQDLGEKIRARLPDNPYAGIVTALANGDNHAITDNQWQVLRRTGTLHLVAISGLHISLVAGLVFFLARFLWALPGTTVLRVPAPMAGAVGALLAAVVYAALAGFTIPTQRALIMLTVALGGILLRRRFPPTQVLAIALLLVLLHDPLAVMASGFWLSFAAVAAIILAVHGDTVRTSLWRKWGYLQWAIALGMLPLMLLLFQQVSLIAPLANLLAVPVFSLWVVPLVLAGALAESLFLHNVAGALFQCAAWSLQALWIVLEVFSDFEWGQWFQHPPAMWTLACALVGVLLLLAPRGTPSRWVGTVWLLPMLLVQPPAPAPGEVWFTLLDVGQGLAAVVRTREHALVYDAGPRFSPTFDTGRAVVVPYLRANGVQRLDTLIVSHGDNDHIGGAASVLTSIPTGAVLSSVPERLPAARLCQAGQHWRWDGIEFLILNPQTDQAARKNSAGSKNETTLARPKGMRHNNASCVLQVRTAHGVILLTGDIEAAAERNLVTRFGDGLRADILVAPHHGSKTSSSEEFIATVDPRYVLFPVGYRNRYRHPHARVTARYRRHGAVLHDSATAGALEFRLRPSGLEISEYRKEHKRFWHTE